MGHALERTRIAERAERYACGLTVWEGEDPEVGGEVPFGEHWSMDQEIGPRAQEKKEPRV